MLPPLFIKEILDRSSAVNGTTRAASFVGSGKRQEIRGRKSFRLHGRAGETGRGRERDEEEHQSFSLSLPLPPSLFGEKKVDVRLGR